MRTGRRRAIFRTQRDTRQIQGFQHVRRRQLMRERDAHHVELAQRRTAFQGKQRQALGAHHIAEGRCRQKRALGEHARACIDSIHQDADSLVGLAQFVGVGIHHAQGIIVGIVFGRTMHGAEFVVYIAHRPLGLGQQRREPRPEVLHISLR